LIAAIAPAAAAAESVTELLIVLLATLVGAKLLGEIAERIGQPAVLGELIAGVILGQSLLGIVDPAHPVIHFLAELGVIILLFEIGLETDLRKLLSVGRTSFAVAIVGVILPFALGYAVAVALGLTLLPAIVAAAALTATSVGITARVLSELGYLDSSEGRIVLGAAVIDDVLGLIILGIVAEIVAGASLTAGSVARAVAVAFGFLIVVIAVGRLAVPPLFRLLSRVTKSDRLAIMGLALALLCATLADAAGSALIIGAFAAGLLIAPTPQAHDVEVGVARLGHFFVPIFFVSVGASVNVRAFGDPRVLLLGGALIAVGIIGKLAAGYTPWWFRGNRALVGAAMVPRGEVGLIFAQTGLTAGILTSGTFSAITLMVLVTTFVAPPWLKHLIGRAARPEVKPEAIGIADVTTEA